MKCVNSGCEMKFRESETPAHLRECPYQLMPCVSNGCGEIIARKDMQIHEKVCSFVMVDCSFCGAKHLRKDEERHLAVCKGKIVKCPICDLLDSRLAILHHAVDVHYDVVASPFFQAMQRSPGSNDHFTCREPSEEEIV